MSSISERIKYIRNVTFGVEDSLVSTVGLLSGVVAGGLSRGDVVVSGLVLIFVEAFSMGVGSFLSDQSAEEYKTHKIVSAAKSLPGAVAMFISYFLAGFVPLFPYIFWPVGAALPVSVAMSVLALLGLGYWNGKSSGVPAIRQALLMAGLGGAAIVGGIVVGTIVGK